MGPSQRTARPSTDAVVTRKRGACRFPMRKFQSVPAWRKTSIGPTAVEEKVPSRNRIVTSVMCSFLSGLITYVQWHICHLVTSIFRIYPQRIESNSQSHRGCNEKIYDRARDSESWVSGGGTIADSRCQIQRSATADGTRYKMGGIVCRRRQDILCVSGQRRVAHPPTRRAEWFSRHEGHRDRQGD